MTTNQGVTLPLDFVVNKYIYKDTQWSLNPDYKEEDDGEED